MESKTVLRNTEISRPSRLLRDPAERTIGDHSAYRSPAPSASTAAGPWAGRGAALGPRAVERLRRGIAASSVVLLRLSLGSIFFWFGLLKFFPALSPAEALAMRTLEALTGGALAPPLVLPLLALWETLIGLGLLLGVCPSLTLALLFLHMGGTFTPLFLFPQDLFVHVPYAPTFEAQYILKNVVYISAGCVIGASYGGPRTRDFRQRYPETSHWPQYGNEQRTEEEP